MNSDTALVCVVALWIFGAFLFAGTPDMTDALICSLMDDRPTVCRADVTSDPEKAS